MRRLAIGLGGVIGLALVVSLALYTLRARGGPAPAAPSDITDQSTPADAPRGASSPPDADSPAVARGRVAIDPRRQQLIGVRTAPVTRGPIRRTVRTVGVVRYDETTLADINLRFEGWIRDLYVDYTGQAVRRGQPLFTIYSPDLLSTAQEYVLALETRDRLHASTIADARDRSDQLVASARRRLVLWDLPVEAIRALEETRKAPDAITFRSPASGVVIEKPALHGMHVMPGQTLYTVADLSTVWVEADVYEQDMALARVGRRATITIDAYPNASFEGRAIYVAPALTESTRTVTVRFALANPRGRLKPGMFANVEIQGPGRVGLTVPADAVLEAGTDRVVFVAEGDGYFSPTRVQVGGRLGDRIEIVEGLDEGDEVATGATFFLDSESQLRAGLQNYEPPQPGAEPPAGEAALDITFRSQPDPPKAGETLLEVVVKDADGQPVTDASVSVQFFMPAMPTMNMPAMQNEAVLPHVGGGTYRSPGQVMMAGRWDVTVTVTRDGRQLGHKELAVVAR